MSEMSLNQSRTKPPFPNSVCITASHLDNFIKFSSVPVELSELRAYYTENTRKCFLSLCLRYTHATISSISLKIMFIYIIFRRDIHKSLNELIYFTVKLPLSKCS